MELHGFQTQSIAELLGGKRFIISGMGSGKTAMAVVWARLKCEETNRHKVLVVTTASKSRTGDFQEEDETWNGDGKRELIVISWHKLAKWVNENLSEIKDYVVIFDECLPADTLVKTDSGEKEITDISVGDRVLSYNHNTKQVEYKNVTRTIKKQAPNVMYRLLLTNGTTIISTGNHPHWTQDGYKNAEDIKKGDLLYEMWGMRENNRRDNTDKISQRQVKSGEKDILFKRMWEKSSEREWKEGDGKYKIKREIETKSNRKDDYRQPIAEERSGSQSTSNKKRAWVATNMDKKSRAKGWQREILRATKNLMGKAKQSEQGLGDGAACDTREMDKGLPDELQVRHRERILQDRNRMRRGESQLDQDKSKGQKKRKEIRGIRVESVEVLKLRDIKRLGLYRDADNVYCIDVEDNHNFFANGVLTHNCQRGSAGVSSGMGKAFLKITKYSNDWAAFTGTPGDTWLKFYPYMQACNLVKNKTAFLKNYASIQTYKGYPEIVSWRHEDELKRMWARISYAPDTQKVMSELPEQTHKVFTFKKPTAYNKVLKTRMNEDGEFLDTAGALCAELRRQCFTKDKQEWIKDFVDGLESGCVFFYNFIKTGDMLEGIIDKTLPKGAKIWRIDGKHHEIPTAETIGKKDMVLCQWQSGSEGLNLQFLHYWVAVELCYSYSTANQARGRIRRLGQKMPQWYGYLLTEGTIEQDILKCLKQKGEFSERNWCISSKIITKEGGEE